MSVYFNGYSVYLEVHIKRCPLGFELPEHGNKCMCNKKVKKFAQNCYIDNTAIERIRNNFWISQSLTGNYSELFIHGSNCPLDYCKNIPVNVTVNTPSVQCDFNRNGTLCGQCQKNFSLALGSLHCIPCDNSHAALIVFFCSSWSVFSCSNIFPSFNCYSWNTKWSPLLCQHHPSKLYILSESQI